jgi:hypothetical protein
LEDDWSIPLYNFMSNLWLVQGQSTYQYFRNS